MNATQVTVTPPSAIEEPLAERPPAPGHSRHLTTRFGEVEIADHSVLAFPEGLIGLGGSSYALLSTDPTSPFLWLQSLDDPAIALPVTNPHRFFKRFEVELDDDDAARLGLDPTTAADVLVTVTASSAVADFTVNLRAPILVRDGRAHQVINQAPDAAVKAPLFRAAA